MNRIVLTVFTILAVSAGVFAQSPAEIDKALVAAPRNLKDAATVIKWKSDYTYDTLKKGTNKLVCYDLSGRPGHQPFTVECTSLGNLDRVAQTLKIEATGDKDAVKAAFESAEKAGSWKKPEFGSVWIHMMGPDQEHARLHTTIAVPGATAQSLGLPDNGNQGGAWVMNPGTSLAHIMTPGS